MTLVPNLPLRLSGNKTFLFCLLSSLLFLAACGSLKKVPTEGTSDQPDDLGEIQGGKVYNPKTGKYEVPTKTGGEVDTLQWTEVPMDQEPPITSDGKLPDGTTTKPGMDPGATLNSYDVAVLLPFLGNRFKEYENEIDDKSMLAVNFYSGVKMAFDDLSAKGIRLNVDILDTEASDGKMSTILQKSELYEAEMIIGPVKTSNLKMVAEYAKKNKKVVISPLNPSNAITTANPYFVQTNPSLESHIQAITNHALARHAAEDIVLVVRNKTAEKARLKYFQKALQTYRGSTSVDPFKEFIVSDQSSDFNEMDVLPLIKEGKTTVFLVPSWSNENFVYALLRKLSIAKGRNEVVVYGMPQWREYNRIDVEYYEGLNLHISSATAIDTNDPLVRSFRTRYFDRYGMVPVDDAVIGYDVMMYFGEMINKHGTGFQQKIDSESAKLLHTEVDFQPVAPKNVNVENYEAVDFYENKKVNILKFEDYYFQLAK